MVEPNRGTDPKAPAGVTRKETRRGQYSAGFSFSDAFRDSRHIATRAASLSVRRTMPDDPAGQTKGDLR
jgi:hypothetical protein